MRQRTWWILLVLGVLAIFGLRKRTRQAASSMASDETARVRRLYDQAAARYDRSVPLVERLLLGDGRRWVGAQARGEALEIAIGTGRNLPYYSPAVRLTGVDISPAMLAIAHERARELGRAVTLHVGDAQALAFPAERFDTVVFTLALCTIPDDRQAVAEAYRVLRPGGSLVLLEHVASPRPAIRAAQRLLEPFTVRFLGDHVLREPLDTVTAMGLEITQLERSARGIIERLVARKPA